MSCPARATLRRTASGVVAGAAVAALAGFTGSAAAQADDPAGLPTELGRHYGFSGLEVSRFNDGLRDLLKGDLDGDGATDLAVINNARSRIELLLRRRDGEAAGEGTTTEADRVNELTDEAFFHRVSFPTEEKLFALALADMDGDGRAELLFTGSSGQLTVAWHAARATGDVPPPRRVRLPDVGDITALRAGDVDGDGRADVLVCGARSTWLVRQDSRGELLEAEELPAATPAADGFELFDLDGDGKLDLLYVKLQSEWPLRWRLGSGDGRFGREESARLAALRAYAVGDADGDGHPEIAVVRQQSGRVTLLRYGAAEDQAGGALSLSAVSSVAFVPLKDGAGRDLVLADVDGDGRNDLIVTEPGAARVLVDASIRGTPVVHSSLLGSRTPRLLHLPEGAGAAGGAASGAGAAASGGAASGGATGGRALVVAAPDEGAIGLSRIEADGRLSFPTALPLPPVTEGDATKPELLALDVAPAVQGGPEALWTITGAGKGSKRTFALCRLDAAGVVQSRTLLPGLKADPQELLMADLDRDGDSDAIVFLAGDLPRILLSNAQVSAGAGGATDASAAAAASSAMAGAAVGAAFTELNVEQRPGLGLLKGVAREALYWGDIDGDGTLELLVPGPNFARALHLDAAGQAVVVEQFNLPDPASQVVCVAAADLDGDGRREIVLADRSQQLLYVLRREPGGSSRVAARVDLAGNVPRAILVDAGATERLVLVGIDRYGLIESGGSGATLVARHDFEVPVKNAQVTALAIGDVNGDGGAELVMTETTRHQLVIAAVQPDALAFALRFPVYEERLFESGRGGQEPREVVLAELTGDGLTDVAILVHDRLIVYPQESQP